MPVIISSEVIRRFALAINIISINELQIEKSRVTKACLYGSLVKCH